MRHLCKPILAASLYRLRSNYQKKQQKKTTQHHQETLKTQIKTNEACKKSTKNSNLRKK